MAFDSFLKIEGLEGECTAKKHEKWIQIFSFSHSVTQIGDRSATGTGARTTGKADHGDFHITKKLDKCSPTLLHRACTGKHFDKAILEICVNVGKEEVGVLYKVEYDAVVVSSVNIGGGEGQADPMESVSFSYTKITWTYNPLDPGTGQPKGGAVKTYWDIKTNTGG